MGLERAAESGPPYGKGKVRMKKRLTMALVAGALMAAMVPGVASAEKGGLPAENGCGFGAPPAVAGPLGAIISQHAQWDDGSNAGPNRGWFPWTNGIGAPEGVPDTPGQNIKWRCISCNWSCGQLFAHCKQWRGLNRGRLCSV